MILLRLEPDCRNQGSGLKLRPVLKIKLGGQKKLLTTLRPKKYDSVAFSEDGWSPESERKEAVGTTWCPWERGVRWFESRTLRWRRWRSTSARRCRAIGWPPSKSRRRFRRWRLPRRWRSRPPPDRPPPSSPHPWKREVLAWEQFNKTRTPNLPHLN